MANLTERRNKDGKLISYSIRVSRGRDAAGVQLKPWICTFTVEPTWSEKTAQKKAAAFAADFERRCHEGTTSDSRLKFSEYCNYVIDLKEMGGAKHNTILLYRSLTSRIYPAIGHLKVADVRPDHLNNLYRQLIKGETAQPARASAKIDLGAKLKELHITRAAIAARSGVPVNAISIGVKGAPVNMKVATAISEAIGLELSEAFNVEKNARKLSAKSVLEHHRLIHTVLETAVREGVAPYNAADRVTPPKMERKEVNYLQPGQIAAIRDALETEPVKWKVLVHLLLITGARRGEICGLKWGAVDLERGVLHICNNVLYSPDMGIYESSLKTTTSNRFITIPPETVELLREYRRWQYSERLRLGEYFKNQDFVFARDDGGPVRPDSVTKWLNGFSKRHGLPHLNPHCFRHTMASLLYFNGVDSVSISHRLGHAQVSTTTDIYSHVMEEADQRNADVLSESLSNIFLKKA